MIIIIPYGLPRPATSPGAVAQILTPPKVFAAYATAKNNQRARRIACIMRDNSNLKGNKIEFDMCIFRHNLKTLLGARKKCAVFETVIYIIIVLLVYRAPQLSCKINTS